MSTATFGWAAENWLIAANTSRRIDGSRISSSPSSTKKTSPSRSAACRASGGKSMSYLCRNCRIIMDSRPWPWSPGWMSRTSARRGNGRLRSSTLCLPASSQRWLASAVFPVPPGAMSTRRCWRAFRRESKRGTLFIEPEDLMKLFGHIAFTMQSDLHERTLISRRSLLNIATLRPLDYLSSGRVVDALTSRPILFQESAVAPTGERLFSFTQTAFREYFAARYLAELAPSDFVDAIAGNLSDASWEAVTSAAFELKMSQEEKRFLNDVNMVFVSRHDYQSMTVLRLWWDRAARMA